MLDNKTSPNELIRQVDSVADENSEVKLGFSKKHNLLNL